MINFAKIEVQCPLTKQIQTVELQFMRNNNGIDVFKNNGCDNYHGSEICSKCSLALSVMFTSHKEDIDFSRPIIPDLTLFE